VPGFFAEHDAAFRVDRDAVHTAKNPLDSSLGSRAHSAGHFGIAACRMHIIPGGRTMFQRFRAGALGAAAFAITLLSAGQADAGGMAATAMLQASLPSGILAATEVSLPDVKRAELANTPR